MVRLEVGTTKNREGRIFPFTGELRRILEDQREETNRTQKRTGKIIPWVFHHLDGTPIKDFRRAWKKACKAAKLDGRIVHDFRRTAIWNFTRKGVSEQVGMKLSGHRTPSVYRRYNIIETADLIQAARLLDGNGRNEETEKTATIKDNPKAVSS
jgi:integrase